MVTEPEGTPENSKEVKAGAAEGGDPAVVAKKSEKIEDPQVESDRLVFTLRSGEHDRFLRVIKSEVVKIEEKEISPEITKWMHALLKKLGTERQRLTEMTRRVSASIRLKEFEYRKVMVNLEEEMRRKDSLLLQKNSLLANQKEQMAEMSKSIERLKHTLQTGPGNTQVKLKLDSIQQALDTSKEENQRLLQKVDELRSQLSAAQAESKVARGSIKTVTDVANLQDKNSALNQELEEYKKTNRQLAEQLTRAKQTKTLITPPTDETKRKLDAAMKLTAVARRESDEMKKKITALLQQEANLKAELHHQQTEVKKLQVAASKAGAAAERARKGGGGVLQRHQRQPRTPLIDECKSKECSDTEEGSG